MSVHASAWAWQAPGDLTPHELLLLVALADYANERGQAWPSMATLARRCHLHRATIYRLLGRLEEHHRLIVPVRTGGGRAGRSNVYQLQMSAPRYPRELAENEQISVFEQGSHGATPVDKGVASDATGRTVRPHRGARKGVASDATGGVASDATRSVSEPSITITHTRAIHEGEFGETCEQVDLGDGRCIEIPPQPDPDAYKLPADERELALAGVRAIKAQLAAGNHGSDEAGAR